MRLIRFERNNAVFTVSMLINRAKTTACFMISMQSRSTRNRRLIRGTERTFSMQPQEYAYFMQCMIYGRSGDSYWIVNRHNRSRGTESSRVLRLRLQEDGFIVITLATVILDTKAVHIEQMFTMTFDEAIRLNCAVDSHLERFYCLRQEPVKERQVESGSAEVLPIEGHNWDVNLDELEGIFARL